MHLPLLLGKEPAAAVKEEPRPDLTCLRGAQEIGRQAESAGTAFTPPGCGLLVLSPPLSTVPLLGKDGGDEE